MLRVALYELSADRPALSELGGLEGNSYCSSLPSAVLANAYLPHQISPFPLIGRQGSGSSARLTALWGLGCLADSWGHRCYGGRRGRCR